MMKPVVIALTGDEGSGKTTMAKFIAHHVKGDGYWPIVLQAGEGLEVVNTMETLHSIITNVSDPALDRLVVVLDGVWTQQDMRKLTLEYPYVYSVSISSPMQATNDAIRKHRVFADQCDASVLINDSTTFAAQAHKIWHAARLQAG